jgi:hypothetical protein
VVIYRIGGVQVSTGLEVNELRRAGSEAATAASLDHDAEETAEVLSCADGGAHGRSPATLRWRGPGVGLL